MARPKLQLNNLGFLRVAAVVPPIRVADVDYNVSKIFEFAKRAEMGSTDIVLFPELSITGYTAADLFHQRVLLSKAVSGLNKIKDVSRRLNIILIVGLPLEHEGKLFNTAAVISSGKIYGFIPKTYVPGYKEFYEERWFSSARDLVSKDLILGGGTVSIGRDILFRFKNRPEVIFGVEICEDLWTPLPPSSFQALRGANIIFNLSASNEVVGKADYRRNLVLQQSSRAISAYIYSSCGVHESTTDLVFSGHALIAENGILLQESKRFERQGELIIADIDLEHLLHDRAKMTSFGEGVHEFSNADFRFIDIEYRPHKAYGLFRSVDPAPFVPSDSDLRNERSEEIFSIQVAGLAKRLEHPDIRDLVIGISGGLDSTLALLVSVKTFLLLGVPAKNIHAYTMPGFATSSKTKSNAYKLCKALGVGIEEINIREGVSTHFKEIKHDPKFQDKTFENAQARYRTMILMNKANQLNALMVGTGDLSELALGWNTFSGDQISHYNVNAGIPKTLVKYLVEWVSETQLNPEGRKVLREILNTPISPELIRNHKEKITQKTEELIGPYVLHDFFLYHFLRWGSAPKKILFLAKIAFKGKYSTKEISKWLRVFIKKFFTNQWKRSSMPDGPKVGSVSLSPRGDWRMPSDAEVEMWLKELQ